MYDPDRTECGVSDQRPDWNDERQLSASVPEPREHVLLTVLGTSPKLARYALEGRHTEAKVAPVALFDLLPEAERPHRVLALCTSEAKQESWPLLAKALGGRCELEPVMIAAGNAQEDVGTFLERVTEAIPEHVDLTVDVTHGFRHFSFLTYIAVIYLTALHDVRICGAYYGMLNKYPNLSPFLDLRPLLDLPRWVYALEALRDTGSTLPMARILRDGPDSQPARDNARDLTALSQAYLSGLPLELGWQAWNIRKSRRRPLRKLLRDDHRLPLADKLVEELAEVLAPFALTDPPAGAGWKREVGISEPELRRQVGIIDGLLKHGSRATALRLMREWMVSWVIWRRAPDGDWLSHKVRSEAERLLHAIKAIGGDMELRDALTEQQRKVGQFWERLAEVRNAYAHHGMRGDDLFRDGNIAATQKCVLDYWKETLRACPSVDLSLGASPRGRVLVSPIGLRPGVLFSALEACRAHGDRAEPAWCLVICSPETAGTHAPAFQHAKYVGDVESLQLDDAFSGGAGAIRRLAQAARRHFIGASEVLVNVTGGTTLMGLAAEELAAAARSLACPVRRFGLIDRRPAEHQDTDPYRAGEPFWLDPGEDDDAN